MTSNGDLPNYAPNHTPVREIVTVFWDYENCPCPMSTKIATLTYDIKRRIDHFLGKKLNKRIQLYCPMQRLHERTRENATDLGILMMDVASKRKQESVDKRIIADIGLFATELAESSGNDMGHIVLVSGDSDYGYILARLRDKSYIGKIIIFINDYTKETLIQHADHTHCLFQSNLTRKDNPFSDFNQRKISPYVTHNHNHNNHSHNHSHGHGRAMSYQYNNNTTSNYHHFQLNNHNNHNNNTQKAWNYLPYNNKAKVHANGNNISDMYNSHKNSHKSGQYSSFNGSFGASILKQHKSHRSRSPKGRYTQNNIKILQKEEKKNNNVYRRKEYKSPEIISAPPPIPPTPTTLVQAKSNGVITSETKKSKRKLKKTMSNGSIKSKTKTKTKSHRIVSQENLEQQLKIKQRQKDAKKTPPSCSNINAYRNSAEIDGVSSKINECNDEESKKKTPSKSIKSSHLSPKKLDFFASITNDDFFDNMITPNQTDMDELLKDIAPKINVLHDKMSGKKSPKTPKKILKKSNNNNTVITDQLRLVWDALCYCQANSNNTPRRGEIYIAMNKTHGEFMKNRDMNFANECIDACLSYGTVEEMIKGRISSLYILPVILNALTSNDSSFYKAETSCKSDKTHVWITLESLKQHLKAGYTNHLSTYFTLTYLYRIIGNATRLFAFHKDDRKGNNDELNHSQLAQIRFRVRKGAYNNQNNSQSVYNKRQYNNYNNNLTFNYYS